MKIHNTSKRRFLPVFGFALILLLSKVSHASNEWRLAKDEDNIKVYLRNTPNSAVKSFMGRMRVKTSLSALVSILDDTPNYPRWSFNARSAKTISRASDEISTHYVVTNMPWPVVDRDAVIVSNRTQNPVTKRIEIILSTNPSQIPKAKGKVRIKNLKGRWVLTPANNDQVDIVYEMSIDPDGNIPKWVVNAMAVDLPFNSLKNMRILSKEDKYLNTKIEGIIN